MNHTKRRAKPANLPSTLRDVLEWAESTGESYASICELRKIPARLGLSDDELHEIPASLEFFERATSEKHGSVFARTKDPEKARKAANARIRALLKRFSESLGDVPVQLGRADWDALIGFVKARECFSAVPFAHGSHLALLALRGRSSVSPKELTPETLDPITRPATGGTRKAIRKGLTLLSRLSGLRADHPELDALLPRIVPAMPLTSHRARRILWSNLPDPLRNEAEAAIRKRIVTPGLLSEQIEEMRAQGKDELEINEYVSSLRKKRFPKNVSAAKEGYKTAITWLFRAASDRGWVCPESGALQSLLSVRNLKEACADQIDRAASSDLLRDPSKSQTLGTRMKSLRSLVRGGLRDPLLVAQIDNVMAENIRCIVEPGRFFDEDAERVLAAIKSDPALAARFVNAATRIAEEAERRLSDAINRKNVKDEQSALRIYSVAVKYAVQLSRPLRPNNLLLLRYRSAGSLGPNVHWVKKGEHAELIFQPGEIKNDRTIRVHVIGGEAKVLWRWMSALRKRFIELGQLQDTPYVVPGYAKIRHDERGVDLPSGCTSESASYEAWAKASEIAGLDITPHQCRHVVATLILAMHPGNFALAASVLGDTEETVRKHYGKDDGQQAALNVRGALLEKYPETLASLRKIHGR